MRLSNLIFILVAIFSASTHAEVLTSSDVQSLHYPTVQAVSYMSKLIHERTGGKYSITVNSSSKNSERYSVEQTRNGIQTMARVNVAPLTNIVPAMVIPSLPYLFRSTEHARRILDGPIGDELLATLESQGLIGLCFYDSGPRSFFTFEKPIRTPDGLRGLKVRVQLSGMWTAMAQALGATAAPYGFDQLYSALRVRAVDAAEINMSSYASLRLYEVANIFSLTEHSMAPDTLVFSKKVWDGVTPKDQAIIRAAAKESAAYMHEKWDENEVTARRVIEAAGVRIVTDVDKPAFIEATRPVYPMFVTNPALLDIVSRIRAVSR